MFAYRGGESGRESAARDPRDSDKIVARSRTASRIAKSSGLMGFRAIYKASFAALFTRQASSPNKGRIRRIFSRNRRAGGNLRWIYETKRNARNGGVVDDDTIFVKFSFHGAIYE